MAVKPSSEAKPRIVAVILTRNEANNIAACINSVKPWVDAIVVWDSGSVDDTRAIAKRCGALVVYRPFDNYAAQRQAALDAIEAEWILFVDADERFTAMLGQELLDFLEKDDPNIAGAWLPRRNFIVGHEVRGAGYYPDYQLRLLRRSRAEYVAEREVHEIVDVDGEEVYFEQPLTHYNYASWAHFHSKQPTYAKYEAGILAQRGIHPKPHNFILQPLREFRRRYISLRGYIDGLFGLQFSLWLAWYYGFMPYIYLMTDKSLYED